MACKVTEETVKLREESIKKELKVNGQNLACEVDTDRGHTTVTRKAIQSLLEGSGLVRQGWIKAFKFAFSKILRTGCTQS